MSGEGGGGDSLGIRELLGKHDSLLQHGKDGKVESTSGSSLDGKYIALYFSAHWCPPCRAFTPLLAKTYQTLTAAGKPVEVVFVSSDSNQEQFDEYYASMPWLALPYKQAALRSSLARRLGVSGIPMLAIVAPDGRVVNANARAAVMRDPEGLQFPWEGMAEPKQPNLSMWLAIAFVIWMLVRWLWPSKPTA